MCDIINHKTCGYFYINKENGITTYTLNQKGESHLYGKNYLGFLYILSLLRIKCNVVYIYKDEGVKCENLNEFISKLKSLRQRISPIKRRCKNWCEER